MPWICDKCGEIADGAMCVKCGHSKPHKALVQSATAQLYTGSGGPVADVADDLAKTPKWGPVAWVSLFFAVLIFGLVAYASTL